MSIADRGLTGAVWNYAGNVSRLALQFVIGVVLARLLGPDVFGVVAILLLLISIGQLFSDFGLSAALVQAPEITSAEVSAISGYQIGLGLLLTLVTAAGAEPIAFFFGNSDAVQPIQAISIMFLIRAVGQTSTALLTRQMRFKAIQGTTIGAYIIGYVVFGLPMALEGFGVWSLVVAQLFQSLIMSAAAIILAGGLAIPTLSFSNKSLFQFGFRVILANIANWLLSNLDSLVVGHVFSTGALGFYNRAYTLAGSITSAMTSSLQPVLFATAARAHQKKEEIVEAMLACMQLFLLTAGVILMMFSATAATMVEFFYGNDWLLAAPMLAPLALALTLQGMLAFFGPTLMALGQVQREVRAQWIGLVLMAMIVFVASRYSTVAIAWSVVAAFSLRFLLLFRQIQAVLPLRSRTIGAALAAPLLVCGAAAFAAWSSQELAHGSSIFVRVVVVGGASLAVTIVSIALLYRSLLASPIGATLARTSWLQRIVRTQTQSSS